MVNKNAISKFSALLQDGLRLIPAGHLLLYNILLEPDEDVTLFTQSFVLVGPEQDCRRLVIGRLDLSFSDFTYSGDSQIANSVLHWLSDPVLP